MPVAGALPEDVKEQLETIGQADILVGIPSYNNADTIEHVVSSSAQGMIKHFPGMKAVLINSDGGSSDGTKSVFMGVDTPPGVNKLAFDYKGLPGKGSSLLAIFEACVRLGVKAGIVVDSDLRSITPDWIKSLAGPVLDGRAGYVTPYYVRHKYDGTITNNIVYPFIRSLYGVRVRQPIGGDFGFSGQLAKVYQERDVWETDVARFGIDVFMTTTAVMEGFPICQASLGMKIHDPRDPAASLKPMFRQVTGTIFSLMPPNFNVWRHVQDSKSVPVLGDAVTEEPEPVDVDIQALFLNFRDGCREYVSFWEEFIPPANLAGLLEAAETDDDGFQISPQLWARIVYDFAIDYSRGSRTPGDVVDCMTPIYFGRVASFVNQTREMSTARAENVIEEQAEVFEREKPYLLSGWKV